MRTGLWTSRLRAFLVRRHHTLVAGGFLAVMVVVAATSSLSYAAWIWTVLLLAAGGGLAVVGATFLRPQGDVRKGWVVTVLVLGVAFRVGAMSSDRMVCTDAARYVWDGKVLASGINPYAHAPDAPQLDHLRTTPLDRRVNTPDVRTPYPPLAEAFFLAAHLMTPGSVLGYQILNLVMEVGAWILLLSLLAHAGLPRSRILLAAWAPIMVIEGYLPGHSDVLALPFLCLLVGAAMKRRPVLAGLSMAAAFLIKPVAVFLVPAVARELGWRRFPAMIGVLGAVLAAVYLPLLHLGNAHLAPMARMALRWSFNGTIVPLVSWLLPDGTPVRIIAMAGMLLGVAAGTVLGRDLLARCLLAMAAVFAFSPVVFPWYLVWVIPLLVLRPDPAFLALVILVPLTNVAAIPVNLLGRNQAPLWATLVAFVPFYVLMVVGVARGWGMSESLGDAVRRIGEKLGGLIRRMHGGDGT